MPRDGRYAAGARDGESGWFSILDARIDREGSDQEGSAHSVSTFDLARAAWLSTLDARIDRSGSDQGGPAHSASAFDLARAAGSANSMPALSETTRSKGAGSPCRSPFRATASSLGG
ncbi:hypothetical protein D0544_02145 [Aestuariirhabdus litorea]|uniref:Uncharacterized protein n=1 Tax=Aestuariirhabdus litorea TaxID=2528527 RepID=A0A3P3VNE5_9GAMM|nr:hypothetical protein D0544_02145 [Aestuariirhabdus litorea]